MGLSRRTKMAGAATAAVVAIGAAVSSNLARDIAGQLIGAGHVTSTHRAEIGAGA